MQVSLTPWCYGEADPGIAFLLNYSHCTGSQCVGGRSNTTATFQTSIFSTASSVCVWKKLFVKSHKTRSYLPPDSSLNSPSLLIVQKHRVGHLHFAVSAYGADLFSPPPF